MAVLCGMPTIQHLVWSTRLSVLSSYLSKWAWPKITSGQSNLTQGALPLYSGKFNCICQVADMCPHMRANWRHLSNTTELVLPSAHPSPQCKRHIDRFYHFCTAHGRKSSYFAMGAPFPKNCPFPWRGSGPHLIYDVLGQSELITEMASPSVQPFLHRWPQGVPILYNGLPLPLPSKLPLPMKDVVLHLIRGSLGHPSPQPKWQFDRLSRFAGLTSVTDQQSDRQTTLFSM